MEPGGSAVVLGCGGVGLSKIQGARLAGADRIIARDLQPGKLELARQVGATDTARATEAPAVILDLSAGRGGDYVFEATGVPASMRTANDLARHGGTIDYVGSGPHDATVDLPAGRLSRADKIIMGSYYGATRPERDFPMLLDQYAAGRLDLERLINRNYHLIQINEAFDDLLNARVARGVILFH